MKLGTVKSGLIFEDWIRRNDDARVVHRWRVLRLFQGPSHDIQGVGPLEPSRKRLAENPRPVQAQRSLIFVGKPTIRTRLSATLPGTASAVLIPCPPLVQWAAFGVPAKGLPFV